MARISQRGGGHTKVSESISVLWQIRNPDGGECCPESLNLRLLVQDGDLNNLLTVFLTHHPSDGNQVAHLTSWYHCCWRLHLLSCMAISLSGLDPPHWIASEATHRSVKAGAFSDSPARQAPALLLLMPVFNPSHPASTPCALQTTHLHPAHMPASAAQLIHVNILQFLPSEIFLKVSSVLHHVQAAMILSACARSS